MRVFFRDTPDSPHPIAAEGYLNVPEQAISSAHMGKLVQFTITRDYSDLPIDALSKRAFLSPRGTGHWYKVNIIESRDLPDGTRTGSLVIDGDATD